MWKEIDKQEYVNFSKGKDLKPIESFSDPLGVKQGGNGSPYMETVWGIRETPYVKSEMGKDSVDTLEWKYKFFIQSSLVNQISK